MVGQPTLWAMSGDGISPVAVARRLAVGLLMVVGAACSAPGPPDRAETLSVDTTPSVSSGDDTPVATTTTAMEVPVVEVVRLNEVHYHPPRDADLLEFVEVVNLGGQRVNLQDWCIDGTGFCWEAVTLLEPGEAAIVTFSVNDRRLSNGGETVALVDALGQRVDEVTYSDDGAWPTVADGGGASLHRVNAGTDVGSWQAALPTPGVVAAGEGAGVVGDVVVTEVYYHAVNDDPAAAFIEVMNVSAAAVDLQGWCVVGTPACWDEPTVLGRGEAFSTDGWFANGGLSRSGERLHLVDTAGRIHDTVVFEDHGDWPALADGYGWSLSRRDVTESGVLAGNWDAAVPTPGVYDDTVAGSVRPLFSDIDFTPSPLPGDELAITAAVSGLDEVQVHYRIDFGDEVVLPANYDGERVDVTLPAADAGALIRFRFVGVAAGEELARWPRLGDGQVYGGTVVADLDADATELPRLQLFAEDEVWQEARRNTRLHGNEGYPVVLAFDGEIIDNSLIRIKGNQARSNTKKKWKVMLPAGQHWEAGGLLRAPVDQFDLLPAATDKSFSREILVSDMQEMAGGLSQQVLPMRVEVNNEFFGLYMYGESPDGDWRDLMGFSDEVYVWKAEMLSFLRSRDLDLDADTFARHYERITKGWRDDNDELLRSLIDTLDTLQDHELEEWVFANIDVPQVVNSLAAMRIVQHSEWQHKNYFVAFDPQDGRWRLIPIDFDLTFGRYYASPCNARCDTITAWPYLDYPDGNRLARALLRNEMFRSLVDRRTRELAEVYLAPGVLEQRLAELLDVMGDDAADDRARWSVYGEQQSMGRAQELMTRYFIEPKREMYLGQNSRLPDPQPVSPAVSVNKVVTDDAGQVLQATLVNRESVAVDMSGRVMPEIDAVLPAGLVLPAGGSCVIVFERVPVTASQVGEFVVMAHRLVDADAD